MFVMFLMCWFDSVLVHCCVVVLVYCSAVVMALCFCCAGFLYYAGLS
ncbi:hypothetical protein Hdeb2414_s0003g00088861 [Helianthus debilis subsp. tardiflorus]